jgi:hypothetical protein
MSLVSLGEFEWVWWVSVSLSEFGWVWADLNQLFPPWLICLNIILSFSIWSCLRSLESILGYFFGKQCCFNQIDILPKNQNGIIVFETGTRGMRSKFICRLSNKLISALFSDLEFLSPSRKYQLLDDDEEDKGRTRQQQQHRHLHLQQF